MSILGRVYEVENLGLSITYLYMRLASLLTVQKQRDTYIAKCGNNSPKAKIKPDLDSMEYLFHGGIVPLWKGLSIQILGSIVLCLL